MPDEPTLPGETPMFDAEMEAYYVGPEMYVEHLGLTVKPDTPGLARRYGSGNNARFKFTPSTTDELMLGVQNGDSVFVDIDDLEPGYDL